MTLMNVELIADNPHRDLKSFPLDDNKVDFLVQSIGDLGFWENVLVRPAGNMINGYKIESQEDLDKHLDGKDEIDFPVELSYGHHRVAAIRKLNTLPMYTPITRVDIPIKYIDDDKMLQIMVHENRNEWGHGVSVMVESVTRVYDTICNHLNDYTEDQYEEFTLKYPYFSDAASFKRAKADRGVGFETVQAYIGGKWDDNDIRGPLAAIKASRAGLFDIESCYVMKSGSALREIVGVIAAIHEEKSIPKYFKDDWTEEAFKLQKDPDTASSVKVLKAAKQKIKNGFNPLTYMAKKQSEKFDATKLIAEVLWEKQLFTPEDVTKLDGLEGWDEPIAEALKTVVARKNRRDSGSSGSVTTPGPVTTPGVPPSSPDDTANLSNLDGSQIVGNDGIATINTGEMDIVKDINEITKVFSTAAPVFVVQTKRLISRVSEINPDKAIEMRFFEKLTEAFGTIAALYIEAVGAERTNEMIAELIATVEKAMTTSEEAATEEAATEETATEDTATEEAATDEDTPDEEATDEDTPDEEAATEEATEEAAPKAKGRAALTSKTTKKKGK